MVIYVNKEIVVDSHSHIGKDIFHGESALNDYINFAKKSGIDIGILMTVPSPCKSLDDVNSRFMYWKYDGEKMSYYGEKNPFFELNYELNNLVRKESNDKLVLLFAATFHPIMDDIDYFEKMVNDNAPVAIKIHGIGSGVGPKDINIDYIDLIKSLDIPVIVHTDCDFGKGSQSMQYVRNINRAIEWANFFNKNKIKGILNHGASLDKKTFDLVNKSEYLRIAIGPDKIACIDNNRLFIDCLGNYKNYLQFIKDNVDISKLIYDADYNSNLPNIDDSDYDSVSRVKEIFNNTDLGKAVGRNLLDYNPK